MKTIATAHVASTPTHYRHTIRTDTHDLVTDEPASAGGQDAGPAPYDYVLAGLGACTAITRRMYAEKKGWDIGELTVELTLLKNHEGDARIERVLRNTATQNDEQWERLLDIAGKTTVTKTLQAGSPISTIRAA